MHKHNKANTFLEELKQAIGELKSSPTPFVPEDKILLVSNKRVYESLVTLGVDKERIYYVPLNEPEKAYLISKELFEQRYQAIDYVPQAISEEEKTKRQFLFERLSVPQPKLYRAKLVEVEPGWFKTVLDKEG